MSHAGEVIEVRTPSRLHFGLLALSKAEEAQRQYGGAGVMIQQPEICVQAWHETRDGFTATGPMAQQASAFAHHFVNHARQLGLLVPPQGGHLVVKTAPRPHAGLGSGTQLGMAVAKALSLLAGEETLDVTTLAALAGRGRRSAIGAYGFGQGGFIVEGGKIDPSRLSPLLMRHEFPSDWRFVLISPRSLQGLAGNREMQAFAQMPDITPDITARMCRLVLLGLTPAMIERDLPTFGEALYDLQRLVGECFAAAQGGVYADPSLDAIVQQLRSWGVRGVGQSSWGPTLYAVTGDVDHAHALAKRLREAFHLDHDEVAITAADNAGGSWRWCEAKERTRVKL